MKLRIKHMVCNRCINAVQTLFDELEIEVKSVGLGEVETTVNLSEAQKTQLANELLKLGFELLDDEKSSRVEQIKALIIAEVHHKTNKKSENENYSSFIAHQLGFDYSYLNDLFSSLEGKTIGQFITLQKIERAKELLVYDQLSLSEIAFQLEYNSAQYLSAQFKNTTGMTPSQFKKIGQRKPLDHI